MPVHVLVPVNVKPEPLPMLIFHARPRRNHCPRALARTCMSTCICNCACLCRARTSKARCLHALPVFRSFSCRPNAAPASRQSYIRKTVVFCPSSCSLIGKIRGWAAKGPVGTPNSPTNPLNDKLEPEAKLIWKFRRARTSKAICLHAHTPPPEVFPVSRTLPQPASKVTYEKRPFFVRVLVP